VMESHCVTLADAVIFSYRICTVVCLVV